MTSQPTSTRHEPDEDRRQNLLIGAHKPEDITVLDLLTA